MLRELQPKIIEILCVAIYRSLGEKKQEQTQGKCKIPELATSVLCARKLGVKIKI